MKRLFFLCLLACSLLRAEDDDLKGCILTQQATIISSKIRLNFEGEYEMLFTLSDGSTWMTQGEEDFQTVIKAPWALTDVLLLINRLDHWSVRNFSHESEVVLVPLCNKPEA